jgi:hypothetical protein
MYIPFGFSAYELQFGSQPKFQQIKGFFYFTGRNRKLKKGYLDFFLLHICIRIKNNLETSTEGKFTDTNNPFR